MKPPVAPEKKRTFREHGRVRVDPYYWLKNRKNPGVLKYIRSENQYTKAFMRGTEKVCGKLFREMKERIPQEDQSVPRKIDRYYYYSRTKKNKEYRVYCRKKGINGREQVILDLNRLARNGRYLRLGSLEVSPDHRKIAFSLDTVGNERFDVFFKDLESGKKLRDKISNTSGEVKWSNDSKSLLYVLLNSSERPDRVFCRTFGESKKDRLLFQEKDSAFHVYLGKTRSKKYFIIASQSIRTSEVRFAEAASEPESFRLVMKRRKGIEYLVEHRRDDFYILTNEKAENFKVCKIPISRCPSFKLRTIVPHRKEIKLEEILPFEDYLVLLERENGIDHVRVFNQNLKKSTRLNFPEKAYSIALDEDSHYSGKVLRVAYSSLVTPNSIFDFNLSTKKKSVKKRRKMNKGFRSSNYEVSRFFIRSKDGARVPLTVLHRRGLKKNGKAPCLLTGYGAYGLSYDVAFRSNIFSLVDRGFVFAIAHVRGGGELGRSWYEGGKLLKKKNTFIDFVSCSEFLAQQRFTSKRRLAIEGGSAGGLLIGSVVNLYPQGFRTAIAQVPFVDVVNTMMDDRLPLTVVEYEEWGNPGEKKFYNYIRSYSPYDNVSETRYPNLLVTAGFNDPRVGYWEAAKWVARLRKNKRGNSALLLKTHMGAGHFGGTGRFKELEERAFEFAFLLKTLDCDLK